MEADATFTIENMDNLEAGKAVVFNVSGQGDFLTFYPGTPSSSYDSIPLHKGIRIRENSFTYTYSSEGVYKPTVVATSYGNWAEEEIVDVKSQEISVVDKRNEFTRFYFKSLDVNGVIEENIISFSVSDANNITSLAASWIITSPDAKVYVGDIEQTNGETKNDFSSPVNYRVVSPSGDERVYTVQVATFPASDENQVLSFGTEDPDRMATINEEEKEIYLTVPFGTRLSSIKVFGTSSPGSKMKIGPLSVIETPFPNNLSRVPTILKVTAENNDVAEYTIIVTSEDPFKTFTFTNLTPNPESEIDHTAKTIELSVPPETDLTQLVADFTGNEAATTTVDGTVQVPGKSVNDFTNPVEYVVTGQDGTPVTYTVTVNIYGN